MEQYTEGSESFRFEVMEWVKSIVLAVVLAMVIKFFFFDFVIVDGSSMFPTLQNGERLVINKIGYHFTEPDYGDIITLDYDQNTEYVKRIIANGGDTIEIINEVVYRNGVPLDEPYVNPQPYASFEEVTVPSGHYFVMGDNRANSSDSRYMSLGFVPRENIIGKVIFRFWPLSAWGRVE